MKYTSTSLLLNSEILSLSCTLLGSVYSGHLERIPRNAFWKWKGERGYRYYQNNLDTYIYSDNKFYFDPRRYKAAVTFKRKEAR